MLSNRAGSLVWPGLFQSPCPQWPHGLSRDGPSGRRVPPRLSVRACSGCSACPQRPGDTVSLRSRSKPPPLFPLEQRQLGTSPTAHAESREGGHSCGPAPASGLPAAEGPTPGVCLAPAAHLLDSGCIQQVGQACPVDLQMLQGQREAVRLEEARSPSTWHPPAWRTQPAAAGTSTGVRQARAPLSLTRASTWDARSCQACRLPARTTKEWSSAQATGRPGLGGLSYTLLSTCDPPCDLSKPLLQAVSCSWGEQSSTSGCLG